jgi:hypothetical protein
MKAILGVMFLPGIVCASEPTTGREVVLHWHVHRCGIPPDSGSPRPLRRHGWIPPDVGAPTRLCTEDGTPAPSTEHACPRRQAVVGSIRPWQGIPRSPAKSQGDYLTRRRWWSSLQPSGGLPELSTAMGAAAWQQDRTPTRHPPPPAAGRVRSGARPAFIP